MSGEWTLESSIAGTIRRTTVGYDRFTRPDGARTGYWWVNPPDAVSIIAVFEDEVVFIEEYRSRLRETVLSCPVGRVEDGETYTDAAARELREEAGFKANQLELLETHYPVSWLRKRRGIVFASELSPVGQDPDDDEFLSVQTVPTERALDAARTQSVTAWTLLPLLLAREEGLL